MDVSEDEMLADKLKTRMEGACTEDRRYIVQWLAASAFGLALSREGCKVLQRVLELAQGQERKLLFEALHKHLVPLYESPNGNYVVTKLIEVLPKPVLTPLIDALQNKGAKVVARHQYGCRLLERLLEHYPEEEEPDVEASLSITKIWNDVVDDFQELATHAYGNYVIQHLLEEGPQRRREEVLPRLLPNVSHFAVSRTASHVVQKSLEQCGREGQLAIVDALLNATESDPSMGKVASNRYGTYVVQQLGKELRQHASPEALARHRCLKDRLQTALREYSANRDFLAAAAAFQLVDPPQEARFLSSIIRPPSPHNDAVRPTL
jgi:mRNA-binding protein PUF3